MWQQIPSTAYKPGDSVVVEPGKVHEGINKGNTPITPDHNCAAFGQQRAYRSFAVPEDEIGSENIAYSIEQESASSISKIRSMFVDPGFALVDSDDAATAVVPEGLPENDD